MRTYAEAHLASFGHGGRRSLKAFMPDFDAAFERTVLARGYRLAPDLHRPMSQVEPATTDPRHRRRGLVRAAVLEGIHRCAELGAIVAYVGTGMPFYLSFGFRKLFALNCWLKSL